MRWNPRKRKPKRSLSIETSGGDNRNGKTSLASSTARLVLTNKDVLFGEPIPTKTILSWSHAVSGSLIDRYEIVLTIGARSPAIVGSDRRGDR